MEVEEATEILEKAGFVIGENVKRIPKKLKKG